MGVVSGRSYMFKVARDYQGEKTVVSSSQEVSAAGMVSGRSYVFEVAKNYRGEEIVVSRGG